MKTTAISWTNYSSNPLRYRDENGKSVWGCVHASPGCINCYSETLAKRWNKGGPFNVIQMNKQTPYLDSKEINTLRKSPEISGQKLFICDMTDLFGDWVPDDFIDEIFDVFVDRADVTWQFLTKRADRMKDYLNATKLAYGDGWPLPNVWAGVSIENDDYVWRADRLRESAAAVRFVSYEPAIGPVPSLNLDGIHQVICGGESGPGHRALDQKWARDVRDKCVAEGVAFFMKQDSGTRTEMRTYLVENDGTKWVWKQFPGDLCDPVQVQRVIHAD